jgi:hypothetical protein
VKNQRVAVAQRCEEHLDGVGADERLAEARADIAAGRTFPLARVRGGKPCRTTLTTLETKALLDP